MYYRIVKEHNKQLNNTTYTVEYSKDKFYNWELMFINIYGSGFSKREQKNAASCKKNTSSYKEIFHYVMNLHKNNHKTQEREIIQFFK